MMHQRLCVPNVMTVHPIDVEVHLNEKYKAYDGVREKVKIS